GFSFVFKARQLKHSKLCDGWRNAEDGRKDKQAGMSFDRNRLSSILEPLLSALNFRSDDWHVPPPVLDWYA
ncbi:MAG: hypothetical protein U9Q81_07690, partial [Pseudomonadota bacterium]|nr:hypothetical protein [Pseudomonadota bacterium]